MTDTIAHEFFDRYAAALLARDEKTIADLYGAPSLILFPGRALAVSDPGQTAAFFGSSWSQYDGVTEAVPHVVVLARAPGSVWADVTWDYGGRAQERFCYQLVDDGGEYRIAVLTPMELTPR